MSEQRTNEARRSESLNDSTSADDFTLASRWIDALGDSGAIGHYREPQARAELAHLIAGVRSEERRAIRDARLVTEDRLAHVEAFYTELVALVLHGDAKAKVDLSYPAKDDSKAFHAVEEWVRHRTANPKTSGHIAKALGNTNGDPEVTLGMVRELKSDLDRLSVQAERAARAWEDDPTSLATENAIREMWIRARPVAEQRPETAEIVRQSCGHDLQDRSTSHCLMCQQLGEAARGDRIRREAIETCARVATEALVANRSQQIPDRIRALLGKSGT